MRSRKAIFVLFFLFTLLPVCFGQEKPEAVLIDEFGGITCEDQLARTDNYFVELMNDPNSTGYVVIYPGKDKSSRPVYLLKLIKGSIYQRKFDKDRIIFIRGEAEEKPRVQLWRVPFGADTPEFKGEVWEKPVYNLTKPFVFGGEDELGICPTFNPSDYADLIKANSNVVGHLVIFSSSGSARKETAKFWLKIFTEEFNVPRQRLKVFYAKGKDFENVEFWIVPRKKK
jgi:hypothetical protein